MHLVHPVILSITLLLFCFPHTSRLPELLQLDSQLLRCRHHDGRCFEPNAELFRRRNLDRLCRDFGRKRLRLRVWLWRDCDRFGLWTRRLVRLIRLWLREIGFRSNSGIAGKAIRIEHHRRTADGAAARWCSSRARTTRHKREPQCHTGYREQCGHTGPHCELAHSLPSDRASLPGVPHIATFRAKK